MIPPESRQTMDKGMATGAALTQSSIPRYHCSLSDKHTLHHLHKQELSVEQLWASPMYIRGTISERTPIIYFEGARKPWNLTRV